MVYYEPQTDLCEDGLSDAIKDNGFAMPFQANLHELDLNFDRVIPSVLKQAKEIIERTKMPKGRDDCKDCFAMDDLMGLIAVKDEG